MRLTVTAAAVAALVSFATTAQADDEGFLTVRYEGSVLNLEARSGAPVDSIDGYALGDSVAGWLLVDLSKGTGDIDPLPWMGSYGPASTQPGPSRSGFVRSSTTPQGDESSSIVEIIDAGPTDDFGTYDGFTLNEQEWTTRAQPGGGTVEVMNGITFTAQSIVNPIDFTEGDGILQDFELSEELGNNSIVRGFLSYEERVLGAIDKVIGGSIELLVTKFSVRPGRCTF